MLLKPTGMIRVQRGNQESREGFLWLQPARHPVFLILPSNSRVRKNRCSIYEVSRHSQCSHLWPPDDFLKCYRYTVFMLTRGQIPTVSTTQSSLHLRACGPRQSVATKKVRKSLVVLNYTRIEASLNTAHFLTPRLCQLWPSQSACSVNTLYSCLQNE